MATSFTPVAYSGNTYAPASTVQQSGSTVTTTPYNSQRVIDAIYEAKQQGFNDAQIAQGLGRYGVSFDQVAGAFQSIDPKYTQTAATDPQWATNATNLASVSKGYVDMGYTPTTVSQGSHTVTPTPGGGGTNPYMPPQGGYNNPLGTPTTAGVSNPYMQQMTKAIEQQVNQNLTRNLLPAIGRGAVATGGYGGSRQGIAQGIAMGDTQNALSNSLANLYGQSYYQDRNYDLTRIGQDQGFYTAQRGLDLQQRGQSMNGYLSALNAMSGLGQGMTNIGQQQMYAGLGPLQGLSGILNPYTGLNQQGASYGGGLAGALGGGLTAAQLVRLLGG